MVTFQSAIDEARLPLNDRDKVRYPDDVLLVYATSAVREIAMHRPDLFTVMGSLPCTTAYLRQSVASCTPPGMYLIDVHAVEGGRSVTKADFDTLRRFRPGFRNDPADECENWFPISVDQTKRPQPDFYIYPKAPAGQVLWVQYVKEPFTTLPVIGDAIPLDDQLAPAVTAYIIFRAEAIDDEHVLTQRAAQEYMRFAQIVGIAEAKRKTIIAEGRPQ